MKTENTHQVFEAVFPAFHMSNHVMLHAAHSTEFALVVWWNGFAGAAVFPHILKACKHVMIVD